MVFFTGAFGVIALAVWIFCIIDAMTTPRDQVRNLPKLAWVLLVIVLVDVGSIAWLLAGRPWNQRAMASSGGRSGSAGASGFGGSSRRSPVRPSNPDDDDEFLATLARRAAEQRQRALDPRNDEPKDTPGPDGPSTPA